MKLIIGLGNPGRGYTANRHNIGFRCLNHLAKAQGISFDKKQGQARTGTGAVADCPVVLAKPQVYMNLSGQSASQLAKKLQLDPADIIVIHDDLDLPLGKIRIRRGGSSGGHKGIDSIIGELGSRDFLRLRIGIGRPEDAGEDDIIDYVLSDFTPEEKRVIDRVIPQVSAAIGCLLSEGLTAAMNEYN